MGTPDLIHLHIGLPKSGTTFLQTRMWHNRASLRAQRMRYPGQDRMDHFHGTRVARGLAAEGTPSALTWQRLLQEAGTSTGRVLLSHEFFCMATAEQATRLLESLPSARVHVVITARDYVRQFPAVWQEAVKMGTVGSFESFMDQIVTGGRRGAPWGWDSQDLPAIVDRWSEALERTGSDPLTLVTVPPAGADPELLWQRWCQAVGIDDHDFAPDGARPNASIGAAQAALLQRVAPHLQHPLDLAQERHRWLRGYLAHEVLSAQRGAAIALAPHHREALHTIAERSVAELAGRRVSVVGDLQDLQPRDDARPEAAVPDATDTTELLDVAVVAIERMLRDVRELTAERDSAEQLVRDLRRQHRLRRRPLRRLVGLLRRAARLHRRRTDLGQEQR